MHCALWRGCGGSTYGLIVLRLCRTSTPPANPPVGGCMPVNYCTLGEEEREEGRGREGDEEHRNKKEKKKKRRRWRRRRSESHRERERERSPLGCDYEMVCHRLRLQGCRQR